MGARQRGRQGVAGDHSQQELALDRLRHGREAAPTQQLQLGRQTTADFSTPLGVDGEVQPYLGITVLHTGFIGETGHIAQRHQAFEMFGMRGELVRLDPARES